MSKSQPSNSFTTLIGSNSIFPKGNNKNHSNKTKEFNPIVPKNDYVDINETPLEITLGKRKRDLTSRENEFQSKWRKRLEEKGGIAIFKDHSTQDYKEVLKQQKKDRNNLIHQSIKEKKDAIISIEERNRNRKLQQRLLRSDIPIKLENQEDIKNKFPLSDYIDYGPSGLLVSKESYIVYKWKPDASIYEPSSTNRWIFTLFKDDEVLNTMYLNKSYINFGKDTSMDVQLKEEECEDHHAVVCFRASKDGTINPYIIDLNTKHGTYVNGKKIESLKYYQLLHSDKVKFVNTSNIEFLLMDSEVIK